MITILGPNPAIDLILEVPGFTAGEVWRARSALHLAGGKPVNVARTLRRLGCKVRLVSPLGPLQHVGDTCRELGVDLWALPVSQPTRTCVIVADPDTGCSTVVNEAGPRLTPTEAEEYRRLVLESLGPAALAIGSGSLPPGMPSDLYAEVASTARDSDVRFILDASGEALRMALSSGPWAIKVNEEELTAAADAATLREGVEYARAQGVEHIVVTLGAAGVFYRGPEGAMRVSAPRVRTVNPTGSGDAFLGGLVAGLHDGRSWEEALRLATSAGALAASHLEPDIGADADLQPLMDQVRVEGP